MTKNLTEKLAAGVPDRGIKLAYGEPQTADGHTMIPVAFVSNGFGASQGSEKLGEGGGGGGVAIPIGAYVTEPDGFRFRANSIAQAVVAIPLIGTLGWAVSRIIRATR